VVRTDSYASLVLSKVRVMIDAVVPAGIHVHAHCCKLWHRMQHGCRARSATRVRLGERLRSTYIDAQYFASAFLAHAVGDDDRHRDDAGGFTN
jgi:hypothetical protein